MTCQKRRATFAFILQSPKGYVRHKNASLRASPSGTACSLGAGRSANLCSHMTHSLSRKCGPPDGMPVADASPFEAIVLVIRGSYPVVS